MKIVQQMAIILGISFLGELCRRLIPAPIPASIYGMVLLFLALWSKLLKIEHVKESGHFLVDNMGMLFVCPVVGLMNCLDILRAHGLAFAVIICVSLMVTFGVAGKVTELIIKKGENRQ